MAREIYTSPISFIIIRDTGVIPTVPDPPTLRRSSVDFKDTDLEIGEWARNVVDGKIFYRDQSGIQTFDDYLFGPGAGEFHNHDDRYWTKTEEPLIILSDTEPVDPPTPCIWINTSPP
jgi:hypothetical protein